MVQHDASSRGRGQDEDEDGDDSEGGLDREGLGELARSARAQRSRLEGVEGVRGRRDDKTRRNGPAGSRAVRDGLRDDTIGSRANRQCAGRPSDAVGRRGSGAEGGRHWKVSDSSWMLHAKQRKVLVESSWEAGAKRSCPYYMDGVREYNEKLDWASLRVPALIGPVICGAEDPWTRCVCFGRLATACGTLRWDWTKRETPAVEVLSRRCNL
ncbi:hypothetical protein GGS24DRAFT_499041 [Hypoxylon argillaceum]|nr:hypothetical protein GGS24DRAFT_499041 [Hypoxylon argillaceum]KAI1146185.1 hypothetical protein F4825DRAFT_456732 [Nemania diffusa]